MGAIDTILWPIRWIIEAILVGFHSLFEAWGLEGASGISWVLAITALVLVVRAALIPVFVRQIKSQRRMMEIAPQLKKIQDKYKGKKDQFSREALSRETMALYSKAGTNPFSSCLPLLLQMPIFFGLFRVLSEAGLGNAGVSYMTQDLAVQFANAELFGLAPLSATMSTAISGEAVLEEGGTTAVVLIAAVMVVLMSASQFITQLQIMAKNQSEEMMASPMYRQQRILLYVLPLVFLFSGVFFPLGVMFYWLVSNFWTMGQQFLVIRNMPTPGSQAAKAREDRIAKKREKLGLPPLGEVAEDDTPEPTKPAQRQQPVSKARAKKKGAKPPKKPGDDDGLAGQAAKPKG
jgi:YidC/Oxa1 family membrane protein insertase